MITDKYKKSSEEIAFDRITNIINNILSINFYSGNFKIRNLNNHLMISQRPFNGKFSLKFYEIDIVQGTRYIGCNIYI